MAKCPLQITDDNWIGFHQKTCENMEDVSSEWSRSGSLEMRNFLRPGKQFRLVSRGGHVNIKQTGISKRNQKFLSDFFTTLIDVKWRWNLLIFVVSFISSWLLFASYFYVLAHLHGDFEDDNPENWVPCIESVHSFTTAYLFSIETMTTIGYGSRYVSEECPGAVLGVLFESILGAAMQAAFCGLVIAKVKRGKKRSCTILFSKVACIMEEDLQYKFVFRVGDMRKSHLITASARGLFIKKSFSKSGNNIPVEYFNVNFKAEDGHNNLFLVWPTNVYHEIDEKSPFYNISRDSLRHENFEIIVMLQAVVSTTGRTVQAKTSYLPWDIIWGHRLEPLTTSIDINGSHIVDFTHFDTTYPVPTPWCSAQTFNYIIKSGRYTPELLLNRDDMGELIKETESTSAKKTYTLFGSIPDLTHRNWM
ncbi:inward rectifier potassium channel 2 isoform X2 [Octopus bimaculoides]|uniref:Inward rectifier potassium channel C-terminal domain-containing protein n=2 Tax=Octopus TaxID=6643 RepID=A0A0L8I994_OCTBM|nr:inward rectifier potassium channel 2-like isoform X2 [Octopus sinensis]XP_052832842.1 inward rectifier potassium channel 2 isoform X2 [Octopus bimaculoides]|eukprot:XP_014784534.1 PREDICTED: inward rectifier potassium channel 2-like isoform X2 [Octopus bimaculoides]